MPNVYDVHIFYCEGRVNFRCASALILLIEGKCDFYAQVTRAFFIFFI